jgi:non-specific protein-tyrosine kinase
MELELWQLVRLVRRWWWLLILGSLVGAAVAFAVSTRGTSDYSAAVLLRINPVRISDLIAYDDLYNGETLAATYRLLVFTPQVLGPVIQDLNLNETPESLSERLSAYQIQGTQLVRVTAEDRDPVVAAEIANAVAGSLAHRVVEELEALNQTAQVTIDQQIADTERQIEEANQQILALETSPTAANPSVQAEISSLQSSLERLEDLHSGLLTTSQSLDLDAAITTQQVAIASAAVPPVISDVVDVPVLLIMFGGAAGVLVGAAVVTVLGYLDRSVRAGTDFVTLLGSPQLSVVPNEPKLRESNGQVLLLDLPNSPAAEAIRMLRTNMEFASATTPIKSLAISSPGSGEGKSTIAANLAGALARSGVPTVLIDADLRNPVLHMIFGVANELGLTTSLTRENEPWKAVAVRTTVPDLMLIPSGPNPSNSADLLSRNSLKHLIEDINEAGAMVVVDTPAVEAGSDALIIAGNVDGIMLVGQAGQTQRNAMQWAAAALRPSGARIIGVVVNRESTGQASHRTYVPESAPVRDEVGTLVTIGADSSQR